MMRTPLSSGLLASVVFLFNAGWAGCAFADTFAYTPPDPPSQALQGDPQGRVGRVSYLEGTVSFHGSGQTDWAPALLNYPVVSDNSFWTEPNSRAEVEVGSAALRLDATTEADVARLDDQNFQIEVPIGTINLHVKNVTDGVTYDVTTPHDHIRISQPGTYRISAGTDQPAQVAVLRGEAQIDDATSSVVIGAGETATIPPNDLASIAVTETAGTPFDNWSLSRDNYEEPRVAARYVSPGTTGYQDLDDYGAWQPVPNVGNVWFPSQVASDWAPYHDGRWVWVAPWGWTWVDNAPWGFAPFHYGRWVHADRGWGWVPGPVGPHPVYAPALVAFIGGNHWGLSIGVGGVQPVGWFPLGPGEAYHPTFHASPAYVRNVNVTNTVNVNKVVNVTNNVTTNVYVNQRFATVVPAQDFAASRQVQASALHVPPQNLVAAPVVHSGGVPNVANVVPHHMEATHASVPGPQAPQAPAPPMVTKPMMGGGAPTSSSMPHQAPVQSAPSMTSVQHAPAAVSPQQAPVANAAHGSPLASGVSPAPQHAPGPPDVPRPLPIKTAQMQSMQHAGPAAPVQPHTPVATAHTAPQPVYHPLQVQKPEQKAPLVPSHDGWVRNPAPAPAAAPHEVPHAAVPHPDAPHKEPTPPPHKPGEPDDHTPPGGH